MCSILYLDNHLPPWFVLGKNVDVENGHKNSQTRFPEKEDKVEGQAHYEHSYPAKSGKTGEFSYLISFYWQQVLLE